MYIYTLFSAQSSDEEEDLYQVGRTTNIVERFHRHQTGKGAKCLVGRKNIVMVQLQNETPQLELIQTLKLMQQQGPSKVRGGPFVRFKHTEEDLAMIRKLIESETQARPEIKSDKSETDSPKSTESPTSDEPAAKRARADSPIREDEKPKRHGLRWTPTEVVLLRDCVMNQNDIRLSALIKQFERTPDAINAKMHQIVLQSLKTMSTADLAASFKMSVADLDAIVDKERDFFQY